jgi:hypothetical protein
MVKGRTIIPPLIFAARTSQEKRWISKLKSAGLIHAVGPRLYSPLKGEKLKMALRGGWADIVDKLYPKSLLAYKSALEFKPDENGTIYLVGTTNRKVKFSSLTFEFVRGPKKRADDSAFRSFYASSTARALLENLSVSKRNSHRAITRPEFERRIEAYLQAYGEKQLNTLRDQARRIAIDFKWNSEFKKLDAIIGALLGTKSEHSLEAASAKARARKQPYDLGCNEKLEVLFAALKAEPLRDLQDEFKSSDHFRNKAFFESYFSNYIEGTTFDIEEAEEIIFDKIIPEKRPKDAHDILGTYQIVSDQNEMRNCPQSAGELLHLLKSRHQAMMAERPEARPGQFKEKPNRAGDTYFVKPNLVEGTLEKGFEKYRELPKGIARAIFMMFMVTEVHPFDDGNGRLARIMLNAELHSHDLVTIIIPNVYREDYMGALRTLSRQDRTAPLIRMLSRAYQFSNFDFSSYKKTLALIEKQNWFRDSRDARLVTTNPKYKQT